MAIPRLWSDMSWIEHRALLEYPQYMKGTENNGRYRLGEHT